MLCNIYDIYQYHKLSLDMCIAYFAGSLKQPITAENILL